MATEFARINGSYSTAYIGRYDVLSQNVTGNYTTFRLYGVFYYGGGRNVGSTSSSFKLNGVEIKSGSYRYYPGETQLGTVDINVGHNTDGSFPSTYIGISANSFHMNGSSGGYLSAPTITRQANVTGANDFNSNQNPYMTFNNPGGFRINARLEFGGTSINRNNISNTGNYTFNLTEEERQLLYSKCPNSNKLTVRYVVGTCIGGATENHRSWLDRTMTVVNSNPEFNYFEYEDINEKTLNLTENPQSIIKNHSIVKMTVPIENKAVAINEATMSKYRFKIGTATPQEATYSDEEAVSGRISNPDSSTLEVSAIDSRGNTTNPTKEAINYINYENIIKGSISVERTEGGVGELATLKFSGTFSNIDFGRVQNTIKKVSYIFKKTDRDEEYTGITEITPTVNDDTFSFEGIIKGHNDNQGFDIGSSYTLNVIVEDELDKAIFIATLITAEPNIALAKDGVGIMGKYDENEGGLLQITGKKVEFGETIYEDISGNTGNITLTKNISDYKKIKIYGKNGDTDLSTTQYFVSQEFFTNNNNNFEIQLSWTNNGNGIIYPAGTTYIINDTSMRLNYHYRIGLYGANQGYNSSDNRFAITKIVGYK